MQQLIDEDMMFEWMKSNLIGFLNLGSYLEK